MVKRFVFWILQFQSLNRWGMHLSCSMAPALCLSMSATHPGLYLCPHFSDENRLKNQLVLNICKLEPNEENPIHFSPSADRERCMSIITKSPSVRVEDLPPFCTILFSDTVIPKMVLHIMILLSFFVTKIWTSVSYKQIWCMSLSADKLCIKVRVNEVYITYSFYFMK